MTVNPRQSFKLKLCLWIAIVSIAVFVTIFFVSLYYAENEVTRDVRSTVNSKLDYALCSIDEDLNSVEVAADNMNGIMSSPYAPKNPEAIYALLKGIVNTNPRVQGMAIGFEPGSFKGKEGEFAPYVLKTDKGIKEMDIATVRKQYRQLDWYMIAFLTGQPYWTTPFHETNGSIVVTYCLPVKDKQGKVYAVIGADLRLAHLSKTLQEQRPYKNALFVAIDKNGTFIAHPDTSFILNKTIQQVVKEEGGKGYTEETIKDLLSDKRGRAEYDFNGETRYVYYATNKKVGWTVFMDVPRSDLSGGMDQMFKSMLLNMIIGILLLLGVCLFIINRLTKPLEQFSDAAKEISHGNFHVQLPVIRDHNELYDLRQALVTMGQSIDKYVKDLQETMASKATIEGELNVARNIQLSMVPKLFPAFPQRKEIDIYASLTPAKAVGGDLYDFLLNGDDLYFCIGDVSGKGVPASLFMAITKSLFHNTCQQEKSPAKIAITLNNAISESNEQNMFVTMFIGHMNLKTGVFTCCNCGHNAPVTNGDIKDPKTMLVEPCGKVRYMSQPPVNIPIGVFPGFEYEEMTMKIATGVKLFLYTDGVTEAESKTLELFGDDRLLEVIASVGHEGNCEETVKTVTNAVHKFAEGHEQSDDITTLCFCFKNNL